MAKQKYPLALVTGGAGFIGSQIVESLLENGWRVAVMDNLSTGKRKYVHPAANFLKMDIRDAKAPAWVLKNKPDIILHFAAQIDVQESIKDPVVDAETNVQATLRLMDAGAKVKVERFIFAGSGGVLCDETVPLPAKEYNVCEPLTPHGIAKRAIEYYGDFYQREYALPFVSLRFSHVYGPRQNAKTDSGVVAIFTSAMLANQPVTIYGHGRQTRDFLYVGDAVSAVMAVLRKKRLVGIYHVGTGKQTTINDIYKRLAKLIGYKKKSKMGAEDIHAPLKSALDSSLLQAVTDWQPKISLADGLKNTVLDFQTEQNGKKVCLYPFRHLV